MKRKANKSERMNPFASIELMTMKTSSLLTLFTTLLFTIALASSAHAASHSADTKHGGMMLRTTSYSSLSDSDTPDYSSEYAKFLWLTSANDPKFNVNRIVVSLADQRLYAYHDQQLVAWSNVSSGRPGHETPTGTFIVSEKDVDHHSNLYENAPMPYFMRLTDGGVGMHAGMLPGYPASHGCVRLPSDMARELYERVQSGTPVEITSSAVSATVTQSGTPTSVHLAQE